ncbi:hypothetical protein MNBD_GAMMA08-3038 [hydrothermal vent metagenome]|uniref:Uncharacterized protein n=1 Tax=hydrothermal vent metagenome TaxID=652676 RepID=A0A3B0XWW0_9ZZZZ
MDKLRSVYSIGYIYSYTDLESGTTLKVTSEGDNYILSGGATGEYKLPKSKTSFIRLKAHWDNYIRINTPGKCEPNLKESSF